MNIIQESDFDDALDHLKKDFRYSNQTNNRKNLNVDSDLSQRERERRIRQTLQSRHGPTAETHDQVNITRMLKDLSLTFKTTRNSFTGITSCCWYCSEL